MASKPQDQDEVRKEAVRMLAKTELLTEQIIEKVKSIEEKQLADS